MQKFVFKLLPCKKNEGRMVCMENRLTWVAMLLTVCMNSIFSLLRLLPLLRKPFIHELHQPRQNTDDVAGMK